MPDEQPSNWVNWVKSKCLNCGESIELDVDNLRRVATCPHCQHETKLLRVATRKTINKGGGLEASLDAVALLLLVIHILAAAIFFFAGVSEAMAAGTSAVLCIAVILQGAILNVIFKSCAELIRLLKRSNGLKYSGDISKPKEHSVCSLCEMPNKPEATACYDCGSPFED